MFTKLNKALTAVDTLKTAPPFKVAAVRRPRLTARGKVLVLLTVAFGLVAGAVLQGQSGAQCALCFVRVGNLMAHASQIGPTADGRYDNRLAKKLPLAAALSVSMSRPGGFPKKRLYSRLNWLGLS